MGVFCDSASVCLVTLNLGKREWEREEKACKLARGEDRYLYPSQTNKGVSQEDQRGLKRSRIPISGERLHSEIPRGLPLLRRILLVV